MTSWNRSLYNRWFVVGKSQALTQAPLSVTLLDRPIAIARLPSGELLALDDCCPHRHAPLSKGRVTRDGLQCPYHGWTFNAKGRCTAIPGLAPPSCVPLVQVRRGGILEHDGLIWMSAEQNPLAGPDVLPAFISRLPQSGLRFTWTSIWKARAVDALENFLDPLHTHFIHSGLVRKDTKRSVVTATVIGSQNGVQVDYTGQPVQTGLLHKLFESPRQVERAHFAYATPGSAQLEYRYSNGSAVYFTMHFTPMSEALTQVHATFHVEGRWAPRWAVKLLAWPFLHHVAKQDQRIVEEQALNKARFGRDVGRSTELDLVRRGLDAVWAPDAYAFEPGERIVRMLL